MPLRHDAAGYSHVANGSQPPILMVNALRRHSELVATTLRTACACSRVAVVTLAKHGWVERSSRNFLVGVNELLRELNIDVIYARYSLPQWKLRIAALDGLDIPRLMKQESMRRAVKKFYSRRNSQSWKSVLSVGDSTTERDALVELLMRRTQPDRDGRDKLCRCKTVKFAGGTGPLAALGRARGPHEFSRCCSSTETSNSTCRIRKSPWRHLRNCCRVTWRKIAALWMSRRSARTRVAYQWWNPEPVDVPCIPP